MNQILEPLVGNLYLCAIVAVTIYAINEILIESSSYDM